MLDPHLPYSALTSVRASNAARTSTASTFVDLRELPMPIVHLEGSRSGQSSVEKPGVGCSVTISGRHLLCLGPDIYWMVGSVHEPQPANMETRDFGGGYAVLLDITDAWTCIGISGDQALAFLAKGCTLDLHPRHFPAASCAATGFARMRTIIWRPDDDLSFRLFVGRSYAYSLWEWLIDASVEFGFRPAAIR